VGADVRRPDQPAAEVGRIARAADVLYLLDATQVVGQLPIDVASVGCDLLTGTGRKFLRGPRGTGFLYTSERALERLDPYVAEIRSATWDGDRSFTWAEGARRFETWRTATSNVLGLGSPRAPGVGHRPRRHRNAGACALGDRLRRGSTTSTASRPTTWAATAARSSPRPS
jgi:hypothetical protein